MRSSPLVGEVPAGGGGDLPPTPSADATSPTSGEEGFAFEARGRGGRWPAACYWVPSGGFGAVPLWVALSTAFEPPSSSCLALFARSMGCLMLLCTKPVPTS